MKSIALVTGLLSTAVVPVASTAAPIVFDNRDQFIQNVEPNASEDFESATPGATYDTQPLTVGQFRFQGGIPTNNPLQFNVIAPGGDCIALYSVNGSQDACSLVERGNPLTIEFLSPITAWGADFRDIANAGRQTALSFFAEDDTLLNRTVLQGYDLYELTFFGVDLLGQAAAYARFDFLGIETSDLAIDIFAMDDIVYSIDRGGDMPPPVPLPAGFFLMLTAMAGLTLRTRL
ncbi:MAG: VPLPA-CTERM sorting domain-containing protein [Pseudomonadota bacterium]